VIVTSDHGELFGEQGMVFHTAGSHYQLLHVPLIVRPPGGTAPRVVEGPVQPVDVFHSILDLARVPLPYDVHRTYPLALHDGYTSTRRVAVAQTFGASISALAAAQYRGLHVDYSRWLQWVTSVYKDEHLLSFDPRGPRGLFNIRLDPDMAADLSAVDTGTVEAMMSEYRDWQNSNSRGEAQ
jgi:arylsulfatase A-like enzyme